MLFNSYLFIFVFLPIALILFFILGKRKAPFAQLLWLALWSCVFYAYWKPGYLLVLMASVLINYTIARGLMYKKSKLLFITGITFNIGVIAYFKYTGFLLHNYNALTDANVFIPKITLPLGISFITFQKIGYLADVYRERVKEKNFLRYLVFISFFPQLIAGPIVHYNPLMSQFSKRKPKQLRYENMALGMTLFIIGLAKKVIIADTLASYSDNAFSAALASVNLTFMEAWIGVLAYTLQIYFDFSGYSDMAIGLARMFGIRLPINFNSPYKSTNIIDFWRRWHMTLSQFLRDYVYIPLGGNRKGEIRKFLNLIATMLIGGLWHGANWSFVIWGGMHGILLTLNHLWREVCEYLGWIRMRDFAVYKIAGKLLTFFLVACAWVFFRIGNRHAAPFMFNGLLGLNGFGIKPESYLFHMRNRVADLAIDKLGLSINEMSMALLLLLCALGIAWILPNSQQMLRYRHRWHGLAVFKFFIWKPQPLYLFGSMILFYTSLVFMTNLVFKPFAYFAF